MEKNDSKDNPEVDAIISKKIIQESSNIDYPETNDHVKIRYSARFENDDNIFDSKEISFNVACSSIPYGIHKAVETMVVDEKASFVIHPSLIYTNITESNKNDPIKIPIPRENIIFEIELLRLNKPITSDGKISKIKTIQKGNGNKPSTIYDSKCIVSYKSLSSSTKIKEVKDEEIILDDNNSSIFKGLEISLYSMEENEKSIFSIGNEYLPYKNENESEEIEIYLSKLIIDIPNTNEKKREAVRTFTKHGIKLREEKHFMEAIKQFNKANAVLSEIQFDTNEHVMKLSLEATLFVNKNMCLMEMDQYKAVIENSNAILAKYPKFLDALWIRGRAQSKLGLLAEAKKDFEAILDICNEEEEQWARRKRKMKKLSEQLKSAYESANNRLNNSKKMLQLLKKEKNPDPNEIEHNTKELNKAVHIANGLQKQLEELRKRKEKEEQEFEKTQKADQTLRRSVEIELAKLEVPILYDYFVHQTQTLLSSSIIFDHQSDQEIIIVKKFIKKHLPGFLEIRSGEIWDSCGNRSYFFPNVIVNKNIPNLSKESNIILFESVSAIVEIVPLLTKEGLISLQNKFQLVNVMCRDLGDYQNDEDLLPIRMVVAVRSDNLSLNGIKTIAEEKNSIDIVFVLDDGIVHTSTKPLPTKKSILESGKGIALKNLWFTLSSLPERKHFWPEEYIQGHWP